MRPFDDLGHCVRATKPIVLKTYDPGKLPDPAQCVGGLILVNDRANGDPRPRLAVSNGASWDYCARADEINGTSLAVAVNRPSEIDITPMVRAAVDAALPALMPAQIKVIEQRPQGAITDGGEALQLREHIKALATANLEISEHLNSVLVQCADLMERVEYLERHALAKAEIKAA